MTKDLIENIAKIHQIDFLEIEVQVPATVILSAPYMSKKFIKHVENAKPVHIWIKYEYSKGFIHWLVWKFRK